MSNFETLESLETQMSEIDSQRSNLVMQKKAIESEQCSLTMEVRTNKNIPQARWHKILRRQQELKTSQSMIDGKLSEFTNQKKVISRMIHAIKNKVAEEDDAAKSMRTCIFDLREKYAAFAADATRVASMRQMAAQFVNEIDAVLRSKAK